MQTELTAKTWKGMQVLCALAVVSGCVISFASVSDSGQPPSTAFMVGSVIMAGGLIGFIYARVMSWWHHG